MATQQSYNAALESMRVVLSQAECDTMTRKTWTKLLDAASEKKLKGNVQGTVSNPIAYFAVPLSGPGTAGRSHEFTLEQFQFALESNWTIGTHDKLRGIDAKAIKAGLAWNRARQDSAKHGTVAARRLVNQVSAWADNKMVDKAVVATLADAIDTQSKSETPDYQEVLSGIAKVSDAVAEHEAECTAKKEAKEAAMLAAKAAKAAAKAAKAAESAAKKSKKNAPVLEPIDNVIVESESIPIVESIEDSMLESVA